MSKDPAFPFYTQDFLVGTMYFSDEQVGIYMRLLCSQHQHGGLVNKLVFHTMVKDHEVVKAKFIETEHGFYNERLMEEMVKRQKKSNNLSKNALDGWKKRKEMQKQCKSNANAEHRHMPPEIENENESIKDKGIVKGKRFIPPTLEQVKKYCLETKSAIDPDLFWNNYESTGWVKANGQPVKNWKSTIKTWELKEEKKKGVVVSNTPKRPANNVINQMKQWEKDLKVNPEGKKQISDLIGGIKL